MACKGSRVRIPPAPPGFVPIKLSFVEQAKIIMLPSLRWSGGTGIRAGLKNQCLHGHEGSTPSSSTDVL